MITENPDSDPPNLQTPESLLITSSKNTVCRARKCTVAHLTQFFEAITVVDYC
jgi:hypothetical protein